MEVLTKLHDAYSGGPHNKITVIHVWKLPGHVSFDHPRLPKIEPLAISYWDFNRYLARSWLYSVSQGEYKGLSYELVVPSKNLIDILTRTSTSRADFVRPADEQIGITKPRFFLAFGHDLEFASQAKSYLVERLNLPEPILLAEKAFGGKTVIEKLEAHVTDVDAALILLSPNDKFIDEPTGSSVYRARQNVILELGYSMGTWPREQGRTIVVWKKTLPLDIPSDYVGIGYAAVDDDFVGTDEPLRREIRAAFPNVDFDSPVPPLRLAVPAARA